jgi:cysteine desulfurase / selenocysteine lyase
MSLEAEVRMNEITPELIAQIASRLYNEVPGAGAAPTSQASAMQMPSHAGSMPSPGSLPPAGSIPSGSIPSGSLPPSPPGNVSMPGVPTPSAPRSTSRGYGEIPAGSEAPLPPVAQSPHSIDHHGLRAFVERIQGVGLPNERGVADARSMPDVRGQHDFGHMFQHPTVPVGGTPTGHVPLSGSRPMDAAVIRRDFPVLHQRIHGKPLVWLDNAATTQKPQSVIDAISNYYSHDNSNIHRAAHTLAARSTDAYEHARERVQKFLGASSIQEIVFVRGTTEGINLVAQTYGRKFLQPGDEVVLSTLEHHASIVPWQTIAKERGAILRVIPINDRGEVMLEEYQKLLGPRTKIVSLAHASNSLGTILPIGEMIQMAKRYNARVMIDGAQSVAHIPVNMQQLDCDFFVFSGHKIFAPTGIGVVYAKKELLDIMPPWQGGGNMIRSVTFEETTYSDPPAKFEAGTPSVADAVGLGAALDYVNRIGLDNIGKYEHELLQYGTEKLSQIGGLRLIGTAREKVGVMSFVLPERRTEEVGKLLDLEGIAVRAGHHCAQPSLRRFGLEATVRPSLALYNTKDDIDRLVDAVKRIVRM